jgi:Spy/CpxP family protein refolding chaperone
MRIVILAAALVAAFVAAAPALAQTSLQPRRPAEQDLQELNRLMVQRQEEALRQQQQSFDAMQRQLESDRQRAVPVLPGDPDYRGTLFR